jgi:hypothetical protein
MFRSALLGASRRLRGGALAATGASALAYAATQPTARSEAAEGAADNAAAHGPGKWAKWMPFEPPKAALSPKEWTPLKLSAITWQSHDTALLRFNFPM